MLAEAFGPPRARRNAPPESAGAAAQAIAARAPSLRLQVLELVETSPATGEQILATLRARGATVLLYSVKPRLSELKAAGLVTDSGRRGLSESGARRSVVWRATTAEERRQTWVRKAAELEAALNV